jgi:hypothetical protein
MILFFLPLTVITFKISSDIENISKKTKKLIGEYVVWNVHNEYSEEFNSLYQKFNSVLLSKPVHLTLLGLASISKTTLLFFIILVVSKWKKVKDLLFSVNDNKTNVTNGKTF